MALVEQAALAEETSAVPKWQRQVFSDLTARLKAPTGFPCLFSQNAFRRQLLLFSFIDSFDVPGAARSVTDIGEYVADAETWDGRVDTARPLVMAFSRDAASFDTLEEYHAFGWRVLQHWHNSDPQPWPAEVATDPNAPFWSMCFKGMQLFVNMSAPAHKVRKSRNLGDHFLFIVNPRERFDIVAGNTPEGWKVRNNIRARVNAYDGQSHALQLGSYRAGEIEWWQYGVIEENRERTDRCPFQFSRKKAKVS